MHLPKVWIFVIDCSIQAANFFFIIIIIIIMIIWNNWRYLC